MLAPGLLGSALLMLDMIFSPFKLATIGQLA